MGRILMQSQLKQFYIVNDHLISKVWDIFVALGHNRIYVIAVPGYNTANVGKLNER